MKILQSFLRTMPYFKLRYRARPTQLCGSYSWGWYGLPRTANA